MPNQVLGRCVSQVNILESLLYNHERAFSSCMCVVNCCVSTRESPAHCLCATTTTSCFVVSIYYCCVLRVLHRQRIDLPLGPGLFEVRSALSAVDGINKMATPILFMCKSANRAGVLPRWQSRQRPSTHGPCVDVHCVNWGERVFLGLLSFLFPPLLGAWSSMQTTGRCCLYTG